MANTITSPNMNMPLPVPGVDPGPDYALNNNACLTIVDGHNHATGSGVPISPAGLNINSDLPFLGNNATQLRSTRWTSQSAALGTSTDVSCAYVVNGDLYYNDGSLNQIRITQSGSVAGASGTITGLPTGTASASYSAGTFVFQSATSTAANVDGRSFIFRNSTASSKGVTVSPPNALGADYSLTLPAVPSAQSYLAIDNTGTIAPYLGVSVNKAIATLNNIDINTSTSYVQILSVSLTTSGNPVLISLQPAPYSSDPTSSYITGPGGSVLAYLAFFENATPIASFTLAYDGVTGFSTYYSPSAFSFLVDVGAGTRTYSVRTRLASSGGAVLSAYFSLIAREVK